MSRASSLDVAGVEGWVAAAAVQDSLFSAVFSVSKYTSRASFLVIAGIEGWVALAVAQRSLFSAMSVVSKWISRALSLVIASMEGEDVLSFRLLYRTSSIEPAICVVPRLPRKDLGEAGSLPFDTAV